MKKVLKKAEDDSPFHEAPTEPIRYGTRSSTWLDTGTGAMESALIRQSPSRSTPSSGNEIYKPNFRKESRREGGGVPGDCLSLLALEEPLRRNKKSRSGAGGGRPRRGRAATAAACGLLTVVRQNKQARCRSFYCTKDPESYIRSIRVTLQHFHLKRSHPGSNERAVASTGCGSS